MIKRTTITLMPTLMLCTAEGAKREEAKIVGNSKSNSKIALAILGPQKIFKCLCEQYNFF